MDLTDSAYAGPQATGWTIERYSFHPEEDAFYESLFALSNGRIGLRATVDFESGGGVPGFFHARLYARAITVRRHLVNAPVPNFRSVIVNGMPLLVTPDRVTEFRQYLDLRRACHGLIMTLRDGQGMHTRISVVTLLPAQFTTSVLTRILVTRLDHDAPVTILTGMDWSTGNGDLGGQLPRIRSHHVEPLDHGYRPGRLALRIRSFGHQEELTERIAIRASPESRDASFGRTRLVEGLRFPREAGADLRVDTFAVVDTNFDDATAVNPDLDALPAIEGVIAEHERIWAARWQRHAEVYGDESLMEGMRYSQFQLFGSIDHRREVHNVPARGLTSEYHSGHFFYNTEFFALPHAAWTVPAAAKAMLRFRISTLDAACAHAEATGYAGARFPEEADLFGDSASPALVRDVLKGEEWRERAGEQVVHTSADVLYALRNYLEITGDYDFVRAECVPLLAETGQYLAGLLRPDSEIGGLSIRQVMGFDEFHYDVDHHFGTNLLVRWGLHWAAETLLDLARSHWDVRDALTDRKISEGVLQEWITSAKEIYLPPSRDGVIPVFDGYFSLPEGFHEVDSDHHLPRQVKENDERRNGGLVKQADVVQAMVLLSELFTRAEIATNLNFYEPRTMHGSSLSPTSHAIAAAWIGDMRLATRLLTASARYNLDFKPKTRFRNGVHLAACAGAWLIVVRGFLGADPSGAVLRFNPVLPEKEGITGFRVPLRWRGRGLTAVLTTAGMELIADENNHLPLPVAVNNRRVELAPGHHERFVTSSHSSKTVRGEVTLEGDLQHRP